MIHDDTGDSPDALVTVNISPPNIPNLLYTGKDANIELQFDQPMADPAGKQNQFIATVNGNQAIINSASLKTGDPYSIVLTLATPLAGTETVLVSYTQGDISGLSGGILLTFTDQSVILRTQIITFSQPLLKKFSESPFTLTSSASSGLSMTYSSSILTVATATGSVLSFHSTGTSEITARQAGNATYAPARYARILTVDKGDQTITFNVLPDKASGDPDFSPGGIASSGLQISYSSDNPGVATILGGMIHIVGEGTAIITASQPGNANYNPAVDVPQNLSVSPTTALDDNTILQNRFNIYSSNFRINILPLSDEWDGKKGSVTIFNIIGEKVGTLQKTEFRKNTLMQLDAPAVKGIYIVEIKSGIMRFVRKVIIQ
jgi:hypothetical protein